MIKTLVDTKDEFIYEVRFPITKFLTVKNGIYTQHISESDIQVWVIETFGLPGHRYQYHPTREFDLVYRFKDEGDAAWFMLRWS